MTPLFSKAERSTIPRVPLALLLALGLGFVAAHVTHLAPTLEDLDSVNFALAIHRFDPVEHRPHPPGYPVFVALTKLSAKGMQPEARAIAVWGVLFGALSVLPLAHLFGCLEGLRRTPPGTPGSEPERLRAVLLAAAGVVLTLASPLFWFTTVRPLSDVPGLFVSLVAQAVLATAFVRQRHARAGREQQSSWLPASAFARSPEGEGGSLGGGWSAGRSDLASSGRAIVLGALLSGLAIGLRAQAAWLTLPLLIIVVLDRIGEDAAGAMLGSALTLAVGVLVWAIPMLVVIGSPSRYLTAVLNQGGEDLTGVEMLATGFTPRLLGLALWRTFIAPWETPALGWAVVMLAILGAVELVWRGRAALVVIGAVMLPYGLFHLVFHETVTVRYALPFMPAMGYLAICGLRVVVRRRAPLAALALAVVSMWIGYPMVAAYGATPSPIAAALADLRQGGVADDRTVGMHHVFTRSFGAADLKARALPAPPRREWLELDQHWKSGSPRPLWFLADPKRTDLALVDPRSRRLVRAYRWPFRHDRLLGGARPSEVDWYEIAPPGWFAEEGFALTPETAGMAREMGRGPSIGPVRAWVRRRSNDATLVVGGRHLGRAADGPAVFRATIDQREVATWTVEPSAFFLRFARIPAAALGGEGGYAALDISAASISGAAHVPPTSVEQFDLQDEGSLVFGFGEGWHEPEYNPATGALWRWTSERAVVRVRHHGQALALHIKGESPLRYFNAPPTVVVRSGTRILGRYTPSEDFEWMIRIPALTLDAPEGQIAIETDHTFVPGEQRSFRRSTDPRRLGLRIFELNVKD
ncbi:MAG: hypothetical protein HYS05_22425 [Acidobacteria bacterium]|nr:hypothetical protein [Acidobacteriota bacterium]